MTVTAADILEANGAAGTADTAKATAVLAEANAHVLGYIEDSLIDASRPVPAALVDAAVLTCACDLFARRKAPFGVQVMPDANGSTITTRLGADPLGGVRPMLAGYCVAVGFAYPEVDT